jgi:uncharacterized protein YjbI with pentapeptide repeats
MTLADSWYADGTLWTAAGAIAVPLMGIIATLVTVRLSNPVRRLECSMSAAPLLRGSAQDMPGLLRITWDGEEVNDPNILEVNLISRGRQDIAGDDFDQPLEFRVNSKIIAILRTASGPNSAAFRAVAFENDLLKIGPNLIRRHQPIKFTLLASGRDPVLSSSATALRDVDVKVLSADQAGHRWPLRVKVMGGLAVTAAMAGLVLGGLLIGNNLSPQQSQTAAASFTARQNRSLPPTSLQAAETDLKSASKAVQSSGIILLQQVMKSSPAEQPTVLEALTRFIRASSPAGSNDRPITPIIQAALNALINRDPADDMGNIINLSNANLTNADLSRINLVTASLVSTDLDTANLNDANLSRANLSYAFVGGANLGGTNLDNAELVNASFYSTTMCQGAAPIQAQMGYNCKS